MYYNNNDLNNNSLFIIINEEQIILELNDNLDYQKNMFVNLILVYKSKNRKMLFFIKYELIFGFLLNIKNKYYINICNKYSFIN